MVSKLVFSFDCLGFSWEIQLDPVCRVLTCGLMVALTSAGLSAQTDNSAQSDHNSGISGGQPFASVLQPAMSADAIINILQQQPSLLQAARIRMAQALGVDPGSITDQMLFDRIRQDANLRQRVTVELQKRGFGTSFSMGSQLGIQTQLGNQPQYGIQASSNNLAQLVSQTQSAGQTQPNSQMQIGSQSIPAYQTQITGQNSIQPGGCPPMNGAQGAYGSPYAPGSPATYGPQSTNGSQPTSNAQSLNGCLPTNGVQPGLPQVQPETPQPEIQERLIPYANLPSLQDLYSQMLPPDASLKRFGSDVFLLGTGNLDSLPMDLPAGPDYVLGPGDVLAINIWGSQSLTLNQIIDRQGQIALADAGTVIVGGLSIARGQEEIAKALQKQYKNVHVEISLGRVHTVRVYVVGDVQRPGAYDVSSLSTPLNALYAAGGPTSHGSLRVLQHLRGEKVVQEIDLYDFLLRGVHSGVDRLLPGDTILVPPIGPQVNVSGMVRRPAIYELKGDQNLEQVLNLAGGAMVSANLEQINIERIEAHQRRTMLSVRLSINSEKIAVQGPSLSIEQTAAKENLQESTASEAERTGAGSGGRLGHKRPIGADAREAILELGAISARDGDKIVVLPILPYNEQAVYLDGHVFRPGKYPYHDGMTVNDLLSSYQDVMPEPSDHAELIRLEAPDYRPVTIDLSLPEVLQGNQHTPLMPFDVIRVYSRYEIDAPIVTINGEVPRPGDYPLSKGMTATALINMAGGFNRSAYQEFADLATYTVKNQEKALINVRTVELAKAIKGDKAADVALNPGDVLNIRQITGWKDIGSSVTVSGEVAHPGAYGIVAGERLSSVLERAGGLRETAYPKGAVLERVQVREFGEKARLDLIQRVQMMDPTAMADTGSGSAQEQAQILQSMRQQQQQVLSALRNQPASGRLVVNIDADVSKWKNTQADLEMRNGDALMIPKEAAFILVGGQVYSPSALTYVPGRNAGWYLSRAGNVTKMGDKNEMYIIRANGAVVGRRGHFQGSILSVRMQPGDSVIVPEKIRGAPLWRSLMSIGQMMSSIAITAGLAGGF